MESGLRPSKSETALPVQEDSEEGCSSFGSAGSSPDEGLESYRTADDSSNPAIERLLLEAVGGTPEFLRSSSSPATSSTDTFEAEVRERVAAVVIQAQDAWRRLVERATVAAAVAARAGLSLRSIAADRKAQVTAASAATGAVALGAGGGATGLAAGSALGAALGVVPALFTFGLSIPLGAVAGGSAGLVLGTAVGGTAGALGGGAAGYGAYSKRAEIGLCASYLGERAREAAEHIKGASTEALGKAREAADVTTAQAFASAEYVCEKASIVKSSLVWHSSTGGTESAE